MIPSDGTPRRLYLMQLERTTIPIGGSNYGMVVCYLIQTSDGKNILVDSGRHPGGLRAAPGRAAPHARAHRCHAAGRAWSAPGGY